MTDKTVDLRSDEAKLEATINELLARVTVLEDGQDELQTKQTIIIDGYKFAAAQTRSLFGMGILAQISSEIYSKLTK